MLFVVLIWIFNSIQFNSNQIKSFVVPRSYVSLCGWLSRCWLWHPWRSVELWTGHRLGPSSSPPNSLQDHPRLQLQPRNRILWDSYGRGGFALVNNSSAILLIHVKDGYVEVADVIDVFIVGESYWTAGGDTKPLYLLPLLQQGSQLPYQENILHVVIDAFPPEGRFDGWVADTFIRDYMGREGLKRSPFLFFLIIY